MIEVKTEKASKAVAALDRRLAPLINELGARYTCTIDVPQPSMRKLSWFDGGTRYQPARPVFPMTPLARARMFERARVKFGERIRSGDPLSIMPVLTVAANGFRDAWVERLSTSGGDIVWAPLSPRYLAWKRRRGLDTRIGVATGAMLAAVRRGLIVVRKA